MQLHDEVALVTGGTAGIGRGMGGAYPRRGAVVAIYGRRHDETDGPASAHIIGRD